MAQKGKNQPEMPETWVWSLGWENTLGTATHSSILAWRIPWTEKHSQAVVHGVAKSRTRLNDFHFHFKWKYFYVFKLFFSLFATKTFNGAYVCSILGNIFYVVESQVSSLTLQDLHKNQITSVSLFFCFAYRVIITIFLNSIYMC